MTFIPKRIKPQIETSLQLDTVNFIKNSLAAISRSYDYAYPNNFFEEDRAHAALTKMMGQVRILQEFVNNLK